MELFVVYHKIKPDFISEPDTFDWRDYEFVAVVKPDDDVVDVLEDVFRVTNNIDRDWQKNPEVIKTADKKGFRSTSVGDLVVRVPIGPAINLSVHMVCGCGYKEVTAKEVADGNL